MSVIDLTVTYLVDLNIEGTVPCTDKCRRYTLPDKTARFKRTGERHVLLQCQVEECPFKGVNQKKNRNQSWGIFALRIFDKIRWQKMVPPKKICDVDLDDLLNDSEEERFLGPEFGDE